jgi:hypothetical protein
MKMEYITTSEFVCINCGKALPEPPGIKDTKGKQLYCSKYCNGKYYRTTTPEQRKAHKEIIRNIRLYPERECEYCGKKFRVHAREKHKYCSYLCSMNDIRERNKQTNIKIAEKSEQSFQQAIIQGEHICIYCGKPLPDTGMRHRKLYCSRSCTDAYYRDIPPEQQKRNREIIRSLYAPERQCLNCGEVFTATEYQVREKAKFCSRRCKLKYNRREEVSKIRELGRTVKESGAQIRVDDFVVSLWRNGYSRKSISEAFGLKYATLKMWIYKSKNPDIKYEQINPAGHHPDVDYAYKNALSAAEWVTALKDKTRGYPKRDVRLINSGTVHLICEKINVNKGVGNLAEIARSKTGLNPLDGETFAFTAMNFRVVRCIYYDGSALNMVEYRIDSGSYPWPSPQLGSSIEINSDDFGLLLSGLNRCRNKLSWNDFDL